MFPVDCDQYIIIRKCYEDQEFRNRRQFVSVTRHCPRQIERRQRGRSSTSGSEIVFKNESVFRIYIQQLRLFGQVKTFFALEEQTKKLSLHLVVRYGHQKS